MSGARGWLLDATAAVVAGVVGVVSAPVVWLGMAVAAVVAESGWRAGLAQLEDAELFRRPELAAPGVAVALEWRATGRGVRAFVAHPGRDAVWCCGREWWPLTADAVALFARRARRGPRALCSS